MCIRQGKGGRWDGLGKSVLSLRFVCGDSMAEFSIRSNGKSYRGGGKGPASGLVGIGSGLLFGAGSLASQCNRMMVVMPLLGSLVRSSGGNLDSRDGY